MKITKRQLRRIIREASDWYDEEAGHETLADRKFADSQQLKSFKIPYKNYGYQGRQIISRDQAWLEFVPKGSPPITQEDMFRAVTLLDSDDLEIGLAMATVHAPKNAGPLESYDVYSVYATTTG